MKTFKTKQDAASFLVSKLDKFVEEAHDFFVKNEWGYSIKGYSGTPVPTKQQIKKTVLHLIRTSLEEYSNSSSYFETGRIAVTFDYQPIKQEWHVKAYVIACSVSSW